jgi:uncharacterized membrane protein
LPAFLALIFACFGFWDVNYVLNFLYLPVILWLGKHKERHTSNWGNWVQSFQHIENVLHDVCFNHHVKKGVGVNPPLMATIA